MTCWQDIRRLAVKRQEREVMRQLGQHRQEVALLRKLLASQTQSPNDAVTSSPCMSAESHTSAAHTAAVGRASVSVGVSPTAGALPTGTSATPKMGALVPDVSASPTTSVLPPRIGVPLEFGAAVESDRGASCADVSAPLSVASPDVAPPSIASPSIASPGGSTSMSPDTMNSILKLM